MTAEVESIDVFEAMGTAISMRWLKPEPVSEEVLDKVVWAATRASNPGNAQPWDFVIVRDEPTRREVAAMITARLRGLGPRADDDEALDTIDRRMMGGVRHLIDSLGDVPVLLFICGRNVYPPVGPREPMMYSAAFGAAQNLQVAARALGLGAAGTSFHLAAEDAIKARLGIPDDVQICVTFAVGWPARQFAEIKRKPIGEVIHHDRW